MRTPHRPSAVLLTAVVAAVGLAAARADATPDNALKITMKKMQAQVLNGDTKGLVATFDATKGKGRPELANWSAISDKGRAAAAKGDIAGAKATCKECHDAYRNEYKAKWGSKAP